MATSKYLTGTISGLLFVTKIYEIPKMKISNRDPCPSGEGIGIQDRSRFSRFVLLVIEKVMREIRPEMTHSTNCVPPCGF